MSTRRALHILLATAVALLSGSVALAAQADDAPAPAPAPVPTPSPPASTSNVDPGTTVKWDPETGFDSPLPFDVQFYISLAVDETVQSMSGRYVGDTSPLYCEKAFPRIRQVVDYGFGPRDLIASEQRRVLLMGGWQKDPRRSVNEARLNVVKGLLPNRHYCFEITKIRKLDTEDAEFQQRLAKEVDRVLRERDQEITSDRIRMEAYEDLRQATIDAIEAELGANERLVVPSGSFLDGTTETLSLPATEKRGFDDVIQVQSNRSDQIDNFSKQAESIAKALDRLFAEPALGGVREALDSESLKQLLAWIDLNSTPTALKEVSEGTVDLNGALAEQRGETASGRAKPWLDIWTPDDLAVRVNNLNETSKSLAALADVAGGTGTAAAPAAAPGEDDAEDPPAEGSTGAGTTSLKKAIAEARAAIRFVLEEDFDELKNLFDERSRSMAVLLRYLSRVVVERLLIEGTTTASYETQFNWYLGLDLGFAWANDIEDLFSYFGTNIYFRPVNKKAPLSWSNFRRGQRTSELMKRLSITIGITVDDLEKRDLGGGQLATNQFQTPTQDTLISGVIGDSQLVTGLGFRLNRYLRLTAGVLVFKDRDPDPLIDRDELAWSPLLSISIDFDVKSSLEKRFKR